jgi:aflatoxin B1 aldehyde reductase
MLKHNQVGSSEEYLQKLDWQARGLTMDTKVFPNVAGFFGRPQTHSRLEDMRKSLDESLAALGADSLDLWYLHGPGRSVPLETAKAMDTLLKQGKFKRWGVSNFMAWEGMYDNLTS